MAQCCAAAREEEVMAEKLKGLFAAKKPRREFTISVDQETYAIVRRIKAETGKSGPKVAAALIEAGLKEYERNKEKTGT